MSEKTIKIMFGLEAQGHIKTINEYFKKHDKEKFIYKGVEINPNPRFMEFHWKEIGRIIGWSPFTACLKYFKWIEENEPLPKPPEGKS